MADSAPKSYSSDPVLYLYTSLTSGSSHIVTATSRMETILKANRIPFKALDIATDEKARMIWGRRAGKDETGRARKIPGLVQMGLVIGDLVEVEEWNEYGELKQHVKIVYEGAPPVAPLRPTTKATTPTTASTSAKAEVAQENKKPETVSAEPPKAVEAPAPSAPSSITLVMRQAGQEAAQKAKDSKKKPAETLEGVGKAEPESVELVDSKTAAVPSPIAIPPAEKDVVGDKAVPKTPGAGADDKRSTAVLESLQSPNSTSWKPTDTDAPVLTHRGSALSISSAEEIKQVEEEETIPEEDEEDDEED